MTGMQPAADHRSCQQVFAPPAGSQQPTSPSAWACNPTCDIHQRSRQHRNRQLLLAQPPHKQHRDEAQRKCEELGDGQRQSQAHNPAGGSSGIAQRAKRAARMLRAVVRLEASEKPACIAWERDERRSGQGRCENERRVSQAQSGRLDPAGSSPASLMPVLCPAVYFLLDCKCVTADCALHPAFAGLAS